MVGIIELVQFLIEIYVSITILLKEKENNYWNLTYNMPKTFGDRWMIIPNMLLS